jgi:hypothetical protein
MLVENIKSLEYWQFKIQTDLTLLKLVKTGRYVLLMKPDS